MSDFNSNLGIDFSELIKQSQAETNETLIPLVYGYSVLRRSTPPTQFALTASKSAKGSVGYSIVNNMEYDMGKNQWSPKEGWTPEKLSNAQIDEIGNLAKNIIDMDKSKLSFNYNTDSLKINGLDYTENWKNQMKGIFVKPEISMRTIAPSNIIATAPVSESIISEDFLQHPLTKIIKGK